MYCLPLITQLLFASHSSPGSHVLWFPQQDRTLQGAVSLRRKEKIIEKFQTNKTSPPTYGVYNMVCWCIVWVCNIVCLYSLQWCTLNKHVAGVLHRAPHYSIGSFKWWPLKPILLAVLQLNLLPICVRFSILLWGVLHCKWILRRKARAIFISFTKLWKEVGRKKKESGLSCFIDFYIPANCQELCSCSKYFRSSSVLLHETGCDRTLFHATDI